MLRVLIGVSTAFSLSANAQQGTIEEITVTAQKREQSISDIGVSITAFSGADIERQRVLQPIDIAAQTPGLSTGNALSSSTPVFAIRGIGLDDFNPNNNSGVGVYVDDVFMSSPIYLNGQLFDVERVEVLKGPQGTLYGKNATGGAINIIARKPTDELEGYARIGYGRWNTLEVAGAVGGPITDTVNGRIAVDYKDGDGWQKDVDTGRRFGGLDVFSMRTQLAFEPSDNLSALLNVHYVRDTSVPVSPRTVNSEAAGAAQAFFDFGCVTPGVDFLPNVLDFCGLPIEGELDTAGGDPEDVRVGNLDLFKDDEGYGLSFKLDWRLPGMTLSSITGWDSFEHVATDNFDGTPDPNNDYRANDDSEQFYQELRLVSDSGGRFEWVAGFNYSHDEIDVVDAIDASTTFFLVDLVTRNLAVTETSYKQETDSIGLYGHGTYRVSDQVRLSAGLRYSYDDRCLEGQAVDLFGGILFGPAGAIIDSANECNDEESVDYKIGLEYFPTDDILLFANVGTAYKTGVYYASAVFAPTWAYIDPEEIFSYEFGGKLTLLDGSLQLNLSYFHYDYDDRQSLVTVELPSGFFDLTLGSLDAEVDGAEFELFWAPIEGLNVGFGLAYLDSRVIDPPNTFRGLTSLSPIADGEALAQSPEWSFNTSARYERRLSSSLNGAIQLDYNWTDRQKTSLGDPTALYGPFGSLNGSISVATSDGSWELSVWGRNITDNNSQTWAFVNFWLGRAFYNQQPASYGATLSYRF